MDFRVAVKAFIVQDGKLLIMKRRPNDVHKPSWWDIPGGRLDVGEDPFTGMKRETMEEAGLSINIICPLGIQHFTRDDGQKITMIIFLCTPKTDDIKLSEEHIEYKWQEMSEAENNASWLSEPISNYRKFFEHKIAENPKNLY